MDYINLFSIGDDLIYSIMDSEFKSKFNKDNPRKQVECFQIILDLILKARYQYQKKNNSFISTIEFPICMGIISRFVRDYRSYMEHLEGFGFYDLYR